MRATGLFASVPDPATGKARKKAAFASGGKARAIVENSREAKDPGSPA